MAVSSQANYTDTVTVAASEFSASFYGSRVLHGQRNESLQLLISVFWTRDATFSFK
jgi:hypothetical protein